MSWDNFRSFVLKNAHYFPEGTHQNFNSLNAQCHPLLYPPDQLNPSSLHQRNTRSRRTYGGIDMVAIKVFLMIRYSCRWWGNEADFFHQLHNLAHITMTGQLCCYMPNVKIKHAATVFFNVTKNSLGRPRRDSKSSIIFGMLHFFFTLQLVLLMQFKNVYLTTATISGKNTYLVLLPINWFSIAKYKLIKIILQPSLVLIRGDWTHWPPGRFEWNFR